MPLIPKAKSKSKPKYGEYKCIRCEARIDGNFLPTDTVFCYLCGSQMLVKDMVKIKKPKEIKIKPIDSGITGTIQTQLTVGSPELSRPHFFVVKVGMLPMFYEH